MRVRQVDSNDDFVFGHGSNDYLINTPETVALAAEFRLRLLLGEWFLDTSDGTPWETEILGTGTDGTRDLAVQDRILGTPGVSSINGYQSVVNRQSRTFSVGVSLDTIYGVTTQVFVFNATILATVAGT